MSPCPFDNLASDASKKLLGEVGDNMPGAEKLVSNLPQLTPNNLQANLISAKINPNIIASSIVEGDLIHGTSTKKLDNILRTGYLEPSISGTITPGVYTARTYKDTTGASNLAWGYAQRTAKESGGSPVILRIINSQGMQQTGFETVIKGGRVPIKNIEVWDPVIKKWVPAIKYKIQ